MSSGADRAQNARLIRDSASFLVSSDRLRKIRTERYQTPGFDRADWQTFADLGWFSLRVPESRGGTGFGTLELCALAEQLGSGLVPAPVVPAIAAAPYAPDDWLERIFGGQSVVLPAWQEERGVVGDAPYTRLRDARLTGEKRYVPMAAGADAFLVTTSDGLVIVSSDAAGLSISTDLLQDGSHSATLRFVDTPALALPGEFAAACEEITLATAAYLLGTMRRVFEITTDYLKERQQFGKAIGSFQALQHRMVDLHIQIELTRASVWSAANALDANVARDTRLLAVSRAKARASDAAMLVTRQAIQLHGAIGYTDEYDAGLYLRKALVLANFYGSAAQHRTRFARISGQGSGR
jgi:alkylation response protein AidB-like acyl-CoA dehydrogenase